MRLFALLLSSIPACTVATACLAQSGPASPAVEFPRGKSAHVVAAPRTKLERRVLDRLTTYVAQVTGKAVTVVDALDQVPDGAPVILLSDKTVSPPVRLEIPRGSDEALALVTSSVGGHRMAVAGGRTDRGLKRAVQRLIIESRQESGALVIPGMDLSEKPWIPHREWTICPWTPQLVRGVFTNGSASKLLDIYRYDREHLSKYVEMYDWFGFSGAQLMETCYSYQATGSVEAAQDWQKRVSVCLRDNGQEVTLWAWAAYFSGFGWQDPEAVYTPKPGVSAFDDPDVHRTFDRYYTRYADLAPYVDRFIGHFYDPGVLADRSDVFKYMKLLEGKLRAKNPRIQMGVDCWAATPDYLIALAGNGFKDYLLLPSAFPEAFPPGTREAFHEQSKKLGLKLGIWGWYMTEYESDQMPTMHVNALMMKDYYNRVRNGALKSHPVEYWSEMEAYHLCNIFSMYASSQLLWNPDRDPHEILDELCTGIWGPKNGQKVLQAVELIQDMRSGPTWETYWWTRPQYRLGSANPQDDIRRADESISSLQGMKTDASYVSKFPLPFPPEMFVSLMVPHLEQIRGFAEFRSKVAEIRKAADGGAPKDRLESMLRDAWQPVMEYDTWVGTFGPPEVREQKKIVAELKAKYGLNVKDPGPLRTLEADRLLQQLRRTQGSIKTPYAFAYAEGTGEFFWLEETSRDRFDKLIEDGLVTKIGDNQYRLADWENWAGR